MKKLKKEMDNCSDKIIIGRKDKADFPELGLKNIDVKIDSGAYTGSIHCHNIVITDKELPREVCFNLLDPSHSEYNEMEICLPIKKIKKVKSSTGESEDRIFIETTIRLFDHDYKIDLSLTDRSNMKYPILLGRKLLKNRFVVDADKSNLSYKYMKKLKKRKSS